MEFSRIGNKDTREAASVEHRNFDIQEATAILIYGTIGRGSSEDENDNDQETESWHVQS